MKRWKADFILSAVCVGVGWAIGHAAPWSSSFQIAFGACAGIMGAFMIGGIVLQWQEGRQRAKMKKRVRFEMVGGTTRIIVEPPDGVGKKLVLETTEKAPRDLRKIFGLDK